tara:strand:- start:140 stop:541 length:402 start_codon:yes stop_codon:yes gene_type:complete
MKNIDELIPSDRKFGKFLSSVFFLLALYNAYFYSIGLTTLFLFLFLVSSLITVYASSYLNFLNKLWFKVGFLIGRVVTPLVMCVIFYLMISPVAILMRLARRDELILKKHSSDTYWRKRPSDIIDPDSFKNQF